MDWQVEWTSEAWSEIRTLSAVARGAVMRAAARLARHAARKTLTRGPLRGIRGPIWEARVPGGHRLLYRVAGPSRDADRRCAQILRVLIGALPAPTAPTRAEARELERRHETLRKIGGGIPHEVVRRAWLAELGRAEP